MREYRCVISVCINSGSKLGALVRNTEVKIKIVYYLSRNFSADHLSHFALGFNMVIVYHIVWGRVVYFLNVHLHG